MKRAAALLLSIFSLVLSGCSDEVTVTSLSAVEREVAVSVAVPETLAPGILVEDENVMIKALDISADSVWGLGVLTYFENKTGHDLTFNLVESSINGVVMNPGYSINVNSGGKLNGMVEWDLDVLELVGITSVTDIMLHWQIPAPEAPAEGESPYLLDESYHIYPYGEENKTETEIVPTEERGHLFDNINASLIPAKTQADPGLGEYIIGFFLRNKTYKRLSFEYSELAFDGTTCDGEYVLEVPPESVSYQEIIVPIDRLNGAGITNLSPGEISFFLKVHDTEGAWKWNIHNSTLSMNPF